MADPTPTTDADMTLRIQPLQFAQQPVQPVAPVVPIRTLADRAKSLSVATVHFIGVGLAIISLVCGGIWAINSGQLVEHIKPKPQPAPQPVAVSIIGPRPGMVVEGVTIPLVAKITGPAGIPEWNVEPAGAELTTPTADKITADFVADRSGVYTISVVVAGENKQIARAKVQIEAVTYNPEPPAPVTPPMPPVPVAPVTPPQPPAPKQYTVADLAAAALSQVQSNSRVAEAKVVMGCINSVIGRINGGFLAPTADPVNEIEDQVTIALGGNAGKWQQFVEYIAIILEGERQQGKIRVVADTVRPLSEIAAVLMSAQ